MLSSFTYLALPSRVVFGSGRLAELNHELERLGVQRCLLITTSGRSVVADRIKQNLGTVVGGHYAGAAMHTPVQITIDALARLQEFKCDGIVSLGGGSAIGLGKALALRTDLPQIAVPTTYAGSEMTAILGETEGGKKTTQRSLKVLPEVVIYDVELTLSLPAALSGISGLNALAHAVEALYARDANPIIPLMAEEGIAALARSLSTIQSDTNNLERIPCIRRLVRSGSIAWGACLASCTWHARRRY